MERITEKAENNLKMNFYAEGTVKNVNFWRLKKFIFSADFFYKKRQKFGSYVKVQ